MKMPDKEISFRASIIGCAIGIAWSTVWVCSRFIENEFFKFIDVISLPLSSLIEFLWNQVVSLGLYSQHNWTAFLSFYVLVSAMLGSIVGALFSLFCGYRKITGSRSKLKLLGLMYFLTCCNLLIAALLIIQYSIIHGHLNSINMTRVSPLGLVGILLGISTMAISIWLYRSSTQYISKKILASICFVGVFTFLIAIFQMRPPSSIDRCKVVLSNLGGILTADANYVSRGMDPMIPERWSKYLDEVLFHPINENRSKWYSCPNSNANTFTYAVNQNIINVPLDALPDDIVVMFESRTGENLIGGRELISLENHNGKGCNVYFGNHEVRFILKSNIKNLKWEL